ncbi:hypothetical protein DFH09DRAFT_1325234 [Mycena vulgaris]|nr:hypothetical protein DFH09DRAFT_1325234 [Mycena vulgaris]
MPSAFDILGVLSFAQGVVTVYLAGLLTFRAWAQQWWDNKRAARDLVVQIAEIGRGEPENLPNGMEGTLRETMKELEAICNWRWWLSWRTSERDTKSIAEMSARAAQVEGKVAEVRLTKAIFAAVEEAFRRAGQAPAATRRRRSADVHVFHLGVRNATKSTQTRTDA